MLPTIETSVCRKCTLTIEKIDGDHGWRHDIQGFKDWEQRRDGNQPYCGICPGSIDNLRKNPTVTDLQKAGRFGDFHEPMDPLVRLVYENAAINEGAVDAI